MKFTSPNYFEDGYPIAQTCIWRFVVPPTKTAHIRFLDVGLEGDDSIKVEDGWSSEVYEIVKKSDNRGYTGNPLFVKFSSSLSANFLRPKSKGFRGIFTVYPSK